MRTDPYKLSKLDPCNQPCPNDAGRFMAQIEALGKEYDQPLRLVWAPDVYATLWGETRRRYAQPYYLPCNHIRGWWIGKMEIVNGTQLFAPRQRVKASRYSFDPTASHKLPNGDWVQADLDTRLVTEPRWIVEFKLPDREKHFHNLERYESERDSYVEVREVYDKEKGQFVSKPFVYDYENPLSRVDALGEYPKDGKWGLYRVIAQHWVKCCQDANEQGRLCWGVGRPPNDGDMEEIRADLQARNRVVEPDSQDWDAAYRKELAAINNVIAENEKGQAALYDEIFDDAIMTTLRRVHNRNNPDKDNQVYVGEN